jgi:predicted transposase/invertase (TIGR01784 family)
MLGLNDLKQTRFYQEAHDEGKLEGKLESKLELVPIMFQEGFTVEKIANLLQLDIKQVREVIENVSKN